MLSPYRVLDLTDESGLICSKILADLGAEVIQVEPPTGSPARAIGPFCNDIPDADSSLFWLAYNTNKKSITLNLGTETGREIFRRLSQTADFIVESFPPGYMDSIGLGYSSLAEINEKLIVASITPFGQAGPYMEGLMYSIGDSDRAPLRFSLEQSWAQAGLQAAMALLIAHHYRCKTGQGQHIDISVQECVTSILEHRYHYVGYGEEKSGQRQGPRVKRGGGKSAPLHIWPCKDGYVCWRLFTGAQAPKTEALVEWMMEAGVGSELGDVNWKMVDFEQLSQDQLVKYEEEFGRFFLTRTKAELYSEAVKRGIMLFPVNTAEELLADKQLASREFWVDIVNPAADCTLTYPGLPAKLEPQLLGNQRLAPRVGEHNLDIFVGELGFSRKRLSILRQAGVI